MPDLDADKLLQSLATHRITGDVDGLLSIFAEDARFAIVGLGEPAVGKAAVRERIQDLVDTFAFVAVRPYLTVNDGDTAVLRYGITVRHVPSGRTVATDVADFVTIRDGFCTSYVQHLDTALVQRLVAT